MPSYPDIRAVRGTAWHGSSGAVTRPTVQAGDVLIAIHSADNLASLGISGGGTWQTLHTRGSDPAGWSGTKVYGRVATSSEPSSYSFSQGSDCDGVALVASISNATLNGIITASRRGGFDDSTIAPGASPGGAGWLDLRYAAGVVFEGFEFSWAVPLQPVFADQSDVYTSVALCKDQLLTSSPAPALEFAPIGFPPEIWDAVTLLIPPSSGAGSGGGTPPTPLPLPSFAPGRGVGRWRFTVHDFGTGVHREALYPSDVEMTYRIGESGTVTCSTSVPNREEALRLAAFVPKTPSDLAIGPGMTTLQARRNGVIWPEFWLNGVILEQGEGQSDVKVTFRGNTLDAYLWQVLVKEAIDLSGDELEVARDLILHSQADTLANINLTLQGGTSGVSRTLNLVPDERLTYGEALANLAATGGGSGEGFEYLFNSVVEGGQLYRQVIFGAPRLGSATEHVFQEGFEGGDITAWRIEIDALRGLGTHLRVRGGTPEAEDATEATGPVYSERLASTAHVSAGWRRIDRVIDHPGASLDTGVLDDYAAGQLSKFGGAAWVRTASVLLGEDITFHPSLLGDKARLVMSNQWHQIVGGIASHDISERIIGITVRPNMTGPDRADLVLESQVTDA